MRNRIHLDHELPQVRARPEAARAGEPSRPEAARAGEPSPPAAAVLDAAGRDTVPGRGGAALVARAIDSLHASAGNGAVARLLQGRVANHQRAGPTRVHAARSDVAAASAAGRSPSPATAGVPAAPASTATPDGSPSVQAEGAQTHGPSWTHVGPPTNSTYAVSGSLRSVANTIAARTEAGSVTTTPSNDTETWTPDGGSETILAARVTISQVVELPDWTDKSSATPNQQAEWNRFHTAITKHEAGHVSTDKTSFAGADRKMVGKSPTDGDKALDAVIAKATADNDAYDATTKHGLTQGTGINPNIDEVTKVP